MVQTALHKAVILAAGRGTRMGGLTRDTPKPMLPLAGKPMLEHILDRLRWAGFTDILIVIGYRGEMIEEHFRSYPARLTFLRQEPVNGTGTAALLARDFAGGDPFLLTFGDIITDPRDYVGLSEAIQDCDAVLGVKDVDDPWQGAAVYEENGIVTRIIEKPPRGSSSTRWNSAGLYTFRPSIFPLLKNLVPSQRGEYELTSAIEAMINLGHRLRIFAVTGEWRDVGRPEDLLQAQKNL